MFFFTDLPGLLRALTIVFLLRVSITDSQSVMLEEYLHGIIFDED